MDFLKILLSTLIIALITALVFFALYYIFPGVAEAAFGVSVNYQPEKGEGYHSITVEDTMSSVKEFVTEEVPDALESAGESLKEVVKTAVDAIPEPEAKEDAPVEEAEPVAEAESAAEETVPAEPAVELTEAGNELKKFLSSAKVKMALALLPAEMDTSAFKKPSEWNDRDKEQINRIGAYIEDHGIDLNEAVKLGNITKILNTKTLPDDLQGLLDFIQKEVEF